MILSRSLKEKLKEKKTTVGCWITVPHPLIPELLAPSGFDWLVVDMEHTSIGMGELLSLIVSIDAAGMAPLVRIGVNDATLIKRVLDTGAHGIIVPNVNSRREAVAAVEATRYPPEGRRGVGLYRAQNFGLQFDEYRKWTMDGCVVVVQVEHIEAVRNIDEILTVPGIDAFLVGPYDLSASLGHPGQFENQEFKDALGAIMEAGKRHGIPAGFHSVPPSPDLARRRIEEGYVFLAYSVDAILLQEAARNGVKGIWEPS